MSEALETSEAEPAEATTDVKPYRIEKVSLTKRPGKVVAHAIVKSGCAWIRYRVVNTERGLCAFPPANPCPGPYGRTYYRKSAGVERELSEKLSADVIQAYKDHLAAQGKRPPKPPPRREPELDRVQQALELAADHLDVPETGQKLLDTLTAIIDDPDASAREKCRVAKVLIKLIQIDTDRFGHAVKAAKAGLVDLTDDD